MKQIRNIDKSLGKKIHHDAISQLLLIIFRFVGDFGAIMFAPLGGYMVDAASTSRREVDFSPVIYTYLALKLIAAVMIFMVKLEFKPPGERMLANV